jgi:hypothetical protein
VIPIGQPDAYVPGIRFRPECPLQSTGLTADTPFAALMREMNRYVGLDPARRESPLGVGSSGSDHASFAQVKAPFVDEMGDLTVFTYADQ